MRRARGRLSMTSLIDVIFLLLLFFMLSSTFSRFGEIPLNSAASGAGGVSDQPVLFARLTGSGLSVNGREITDETTLTALRPDGPVRVLLSVDDTALAQGLVDAVVTLRALPDATLTVLE